LDPAEEILASFSDPILQDTFPGFVFVGGNGGLERIAIDCRGKSPPFPIVMVDPVAGPESAQSIAPDAETFVAAIGSESRDVEQSGMPNQ